MRRSSAAAWLAAVLALSACAPPAPPSLPPPPGPQAGPGAGWVMPAASAQWYRRHAAAGGAVLRIDPAASLIVATVRRGGPLARLGHDHVVASHQVSGLIAPQAGRADFGFRLDQLVVDEAPLREQARLDTQPSADAIAGTRTNMLTRVLEAGRYPEVALVVDSAAAPARLSVTLHGVTRSVPAQVTVTPTEQGLVASGALTLRQSDFGITPMSIMNGAMTVQDSMELRYRIVATR
jgi:hypothetical protein